jgi:hypothetical protein
MLKTNLYQLPILKDYFLIKGDIKKSVWANVMHEAQKLTDYMNKTFDFHEDLFTMEDAMLWMTDEFEINEFYEGVQAVKDCCEYYQIELD